MPPRYAYWTIIAGGLPTAFRATEREELLPTFQRIREKHPDATMKWFARGKLWDSPDVARVRRDDGGGRRRPAGGGDGDAENARHAGPPGRPAQDKRGRGWRPGGEHRDPRQKFIDAKKQQNAALRKDRWDRKNAPGRDNPPGGPRRPETPRETRPPEERRENRPPRRDEWRGRPRFDEQGSKRPDWIPRGPHGGSAPGPQSRSPRPPASGDAGRKPPFRPWNAQRPPQTPRFQTPERKPHWTGASKPGPPRESSGPSGRSGAGRPEPNRQDARRPEPRPWRDAPRAAPPRPAPAPSRPPGEAKPSWPKPSPLAHIKSRRPFRPKQGPPRGPKK